MWPVRSLAVPPVNRSGGADRRPATGDTARPVLVHGFTQTSASWAGVLEGRALDVAPGEGLDDTALRLGEVGGEAAYVGYSMGGRLCLHLALSRPHLVRALVLVSATAGIDDDEARAARRQADEALAESIEADGAEAFLRRWLGQPMFARLPATARDVDGRQRDPAVLAGCLRRLGTGVQKPLWSRLDELGMPVLVVAGEHDASYRALGERLASEVGENATFALVAGAGHACHLEQPEAFRRSVLRFLAARA